MAKQPRAHHAQAMGLTSAVAATMDFISPATANVPPTLAYVLMAQKPLVRHAPII